MTPSVWLWIGFALFVLMMLALDLVVFHRKSHTVGMKESLTWSGVWIALALAFNAGLWLCHTPKSVRLRPQSS
jgi:tellurite resistance protein TerC